MKQGLGPRTNNGEGDLDTDCSLGAGLTYSCGGCHGRQRGAAGFGGDVFTRPDSRDAPHLFGLAQVEMIADEMTTDLSVIRDKAIKRAQKRNRNITLKLKSKGTNFGKIIAHSDGSLDTSKVVGVDTDLRVKPFFAQGAKRAMRLCPWMGGISQGARRRCDYAHGWATDICSCNICISTIHGGRISQRARRRCAYAHG